MLECSVVFRRRGAALSSAVQTIDEIFVVPIYSLLSRTPADYLDFLLHEGALDRAAEVVARADLRHETDAEIARREVRSILTAAEVDLLTPPLPTLDD